MTREQKLQRWAQRELSRTLGQVILDDWDGDIVAFGIYRIGGDARVYQQGHLVANFTRRDAALSWCVAQKNRRWELANRIADLDGKKAQLLQEVRSLEHLRQRVPDANRRDLLLAKSQGAQWRVDVLDAELRKCAVRAKYLQLRGIGNETARTRNP